MEKERLKRFNQIFPWYSGLSMDLLFFVVIDTLFLTVVKSLNAAQIVSLTTISLIVCILLQVPILKMIKKIGNTKSVRIGSLLLLISSLLITFGNNYIIIVFGKILYEIAFTFQNMSNVILKNNLEIQNKSDEYIKIKTKASTIYSAVTMIISFIASIMFNINNYLPMYGCIFFCLICYILSFNIIDASKFDKIENETVKKEKVKVKYSTLIIMLIISYGLFYPVVNSGQSNGKLFIQEELLLSFDVEKTALILGGILCVSRIVRVVSNLLFNKIYNKYKERVGLMLPVTLFISIALMIIGSFIQNMIIMKITIMSLGYILILFIRDPFKVYMQDLALNNTEKENQQVILTTIELARKIGRAIMSLIFTLILIDNPMIIVIVSLMVLSIVEILVSIKLYKLVLSKKVIENEESNNRNCEQTLC